VPDPEWGQRLVALVVAADPAPVGLPGVLPTAAALRAAVADRLPPAWLPRDVLAADEIPLLATGKVDRAAVRALVGRALASRAGHA
jgi:O-succinylbenzoic acid--CoA ligase